MALKNSEPLPFSSLQVLDQSRRNGACRFLAAAMYTRDYADRATRLAASCERFNVPYVLHEVPAVHSSISEKGNLDLALTKANFVRFLFTRHRTPILYVDVDCVFCDYPDLIDQLLESGATFAAYNWAADREHDAFVPVDVEIDGNVVRDRYYANSHRVDRYCVTQLVTSGCVQLYVDSPATRHLLGAWQETIMRFPGCADDHCLDFAFNNGGSLIPELRPFWLPKTYARYPWWIYVKPVIDHPDFPAESAGFKPIPEAPNARRFYEERAERTEGRFPETCVVDVRERRMYEYLDGRLMVLGSTDLQFWVQPGASPQLKLVVASA